MKCEHCGRQDGSGVRCPHCGAKLRRAAAEPASYRARKKPRRGRRVALLVATAALVAAAAVSAVRAPMRSEIAHGPAAAVSAQAPGRADEEASGGEYSRVVLGMWYQTQGEYTVLFRTDGTYTLTSYGEEMSGSYELEEAGVTLELNKFGTPLQCRFTFAEGNLLGSRGVWRDMLARRYVAPKGDELRYGDMLGSWSTVDGREITFYGDGTYFWTLEGFPWGDIRDVYTYEPLFHSGTLALSGGESRFYVYDGYFSIGEVDYYRN